MKNLYISPQLTVLNLARVDVIATSGVTDPIAPAMQNGDTPKVSAFRR